MLLLVLVLVQVVLMVSSLMGRTSTRSWRIPMAGCTPEEQQRAGVAALALLDHLMAPPTTFAQQLQPTVFDPSGSTPRYSPQAGTKQVRQQGNQFQQ